MVPQWVLLVCSIQLFQDRMVRILDTVHWWDRTFDLHQCLPLRCLPLLWHCRWEKALQMLQIQCFQAVD